MEKIWKVIDKYENLMIWKEDIKFNLINGTVSAVAKNQFFVNVIYREHPNKVVNYTYKLPENVLQNIHLDLLNENKTETLINKLINIISENATSLTKEVLSYE